MKTNKELELMFNLEVAINALTKYLDEETNFVKETEEWSNKYAAYDLCKGMTYTKLAISRLLDL